MKNRIVCFYAIILSFISMSAFPQVTDFSKTNYGIWQTFGDPVSSSINPEIRGRLCNFRWADIQPAPDKWEWKNFDNNLADRANDGLPIIFMVYTEEDAPEWLYSKGIPKVIQKDKKGSIVGYGPYYNNATYKGYFKDMVQKVREHIETLPEPVRKQIIAVQACFGSTGDYISYKGDVDPQYKISNGAFYALFQEFSQTFFDQYQNTNPKVYVLNNPKNNGPEQASWLFKNCPGGWMKVGSIGKGYQLNDELTKSAWLYPMLNKELFKGEYVRSRSEIIGGSTKSGWWTKAPAKNMFALMCYGIFWGLDWSNQGYDQISDKIYDSSFGFYNRYAGEKDPAQSAFAMCALKDALDAADDKRFPEKGYGMAQRGNKNRYIKIANEYAPYGAKLEDVYIAMSDEIGNIAADGTNDVGWDIFPGNYDRYIHQIKANETSTGYWNIESADKNDMYGKFGRGFDLAKGKDALYFDIEDAFFNNAPLNSQQPVVVEIVYFDNSNGSWQLMYDGGDNTDKAALTVTGTGSMLWKKASVTIHDGYFGNRAKNGADFYIENTGTENIIFSLVELRRPFSGETMGLAASKLKPFSTTCVQGTSYQTLYVSGSFMPEGNAVVGPLKGFGFSVDSGKTYPDSVIIKNHGALFNTKVFVKFRPDKAGIYTGNIPVSADNVTPVYVTTEASSVNSSPDLKPAVKSISCFGKKDGSIDLVCNGGAGPFTYSWSGVSNFKATTEDVSNLAPGTYNVTVNSLGGCVTRSTVEIKSPAALQVNASASEIPYNQTTTNVIVAASGGTAPYTGIGNFSTSEGAYTYIVTDANGCSANADITITKSQSSLAAFASSNAISCHGGFTTITVGATGGDGPYTGTGDYIVSAGTYTYTITDRNGFENSVTITVTDPPALNASIAGDKIICNGETANLEVAATGGVEPYTGTGNFIAGPGIYTYTITDAKGCKAVKTVNLTEPSKLALSIAGAPILCNGISTSINVSATGGIAPYIGTGNFEVSAGDHSYTVVDENGCAVTKSITLAEPVKLNTVASVSPVLCNGETTNIEVTAVGGVAPYTGTGNFTARAGSHKYIVTDVNGCKSVNTVEITQPESLKVNINAEPLTDGKTTTTVTVTAAGGVAPYEGIGAFAEPEGVHNYIITDANGCQANTSVNILNSQAAQLTATATNGNILCSGGTTTVTVDAIGGVGPYTGTGVYTVTTGTYTYTVKDALGHVCQANVVIPEPVSLSINVANTADLASCKGLSSAITVNASGGTMPYQYNINAGPYQSGSQFSNLADGSYTVIVKDHNGCISSVPATVAKTAPMAAWFSDITDVSTCGFADGSVTVATQGGTGTFMYSIDGENYQASNIFKKLPENDYTVSMIDSRGCETSALTTVGRNSELKLTITDNLPVSGCSNDNGALTVSASGGGGSYQYCVNGQPFRGHNVFAGLTEGSYEVTVRDGRGCTKSIITTVTKTQILLANIQSIANAGACGNDGLIKVGLTGGSAPYMYSINGGTLQSSNTFDALAAGIYKVQVTDTRGCVASVMATIGKTAQILIKADTTAIICKGGTNGIINVSNIGGIAPYLYNIDGKLFSTKNIFDNINAGKHTISVKDSKGCVASIDVKMADGTENCAGGIPGVFNPLDTMFKALVLPNPSPTSFTLVINSRSAERLDVFVIDMTGRIVYKANGAANQAYKFGNEFASGTYIVRVMQGNQTANVKIIKTRSQ